MDLFRYDSGGQRTYTTNGDNAYFSLDDTTLLARFNQDPTGDYSDWWSPGDQRWSPPGTPTVAQVQDAFGATGGFQELGTNELTALDIIGYTLAGATVITPTNPPASSDGPTLTLARNGAGQVTLSWPDDGGGWVLQESANMTPGSWTDAVTGSDNPAVLPATATRSFYRLAQPAPATAASARAARIGATTRTAYQLRTHVLRARQP